MRRSSLRLLLLLALCASVAPAHAAVGPGDTRIALGREGVDGAGRERVAGKVVIHAPGAWTRTSNDPAPTARFTAAVSGSCSAAIQISVRVVATSQPPRSRALRVTQASAAAVIADASRPAGWLRVIRLQGSGQTLRPVSYGIAIVRVAPNRWADVRAFTTFTGCTDEQIKNGSASTGLRTLLHDARVHARIVRS